MPPPSRLLNRSMIAWATGTTGKKAVLVVSLGSCALQNGWRKCWKDVRSSGCCGRKTLDGGVDGMWLGVGADRRPLLLELSLTGVDESPGSLRRRGLPNAGACTRGAHTAV